jgi:hypothetical protein
VVFVVIRHWEKDKDRATVTVDGIPFIVKEFEVKPASNSGFEPIEKKVVERGKIILFGPKRAREVKFSCEFIELSREAYRYVKNLDGKVVTVCSPHLDGCMKGFTTVEVKFKPSEGGYYDHDAKDHFGLGEIAFEVKETAEPLDDVQLPAEEKEEEQKSETKNEVPTTTPEGETGEYKPSCAFCMKYDGYKYVWYVVAWEMVCKHCGGKLNREISSRVPEAQLHCTKCGANYCGVCGREKVWDRKRAEKYRITNVSKPVRK